MHVQKILPTGERKDVQSSTHNPVFKKMIFMIDKISRETTN